MHIYSFKPNEAYSFEGGMFDFTGAQGTLFLKYRAQQALDPSVNKLELYFWMPKDGGSEVSDLILVPFGEWLLVTFEANSDTSTYTMNIEKYGSGTITGQPHISPTTIVFKTDGAGFAPAYKELLIWDSAIADNAQISAHKCQ